MSTNANIIHTLKIGSENYEICPTRIGTEATGISTNTDDSALTYVAGTHDFYVGTDSDANTTKILSINSSNGIVPETNNSINVGTESSRFNYGYFNEVYATAFFEYSDERLKTFVKPISADLDKLSALRKSYFYWKDNNDNLQLGVSAQEIQKLYPELVNETENGYLTVAYDKLSVVALAAIDNLTAKNKELEDRLLKLEDIINKYCLN